MCNLIKDKSRLIIFTTEENLAMLKEIRDWMMDGTFDMAPMVFKQLYTIGLVYKGI